MNVRLALTMRVTEAPGHAERRDALAQDWGRFLAVTLPGAAWLPMPNAGDDAVRLADAFAVNGLVLTGGDDWGVFSERDATEAALFRWAMARDIPVLGVCRGAQVINRMLGGSARVTDGAVHAGTRHPLTERQDWTPEDVNSYHRLVLDRDMLAPGLVSDALAPDGTVEAFHLPGRRVVGVLWHPEREHPYGACDVALMQRLFAPEQL